MSNLISGKCALCQKNEELMLSHIFPRFVAKWMKATGTGYFRQVVNPNKRKQDLPKEKLLCESCEQAFSKRETYFKENIFDPYINESITALQYDERLYYFCASILWRLLYKDLSLSDAKSHVHYDLLFEAEKQLRAYLLGMKEAKLPIHLFLASLLKEHEIPTKGFNNYIMRAVDGTFGYSNTKCFLYGKFARFVIFGHILGMNNRDWKNTKVLPSGGVISIPQSLDDSQVGGFLIHRAKETHRLFEKNVTDKTKEYISNNSNSIDKQYYASDQFKIYEQDNNSYVKPVGKKKLGRNDECPCGSGKKFKKCCLQKKRF